MRYARYENRARGENISSIRATSRVQHSAICGSTASCRLETVLLPNLDFRTSNTAAGLYDSSHVAAAPDVYRTSREPPIDELLGCRGGSSYLIRFFIDQDRALTPAVPCGCRKMKFSLCTIILLVVLQRRQSTLVCTRLVGFQVEKLRDILSTMDDYIQSVECLPA